MGLLLAQMFTKCNLPTLPDAETLQLLFAERYSLAMAPDNPLPTGHWGGSSQDSAASFYGYLASLGHVRSTNVFDRDGVEYTLTDLGFKTLSCIDSNSIVENTCQINMGNGEDFGGFCFYRVTGNLRICFSFLCSFSGTDADYPVLKVNLYAGRGGTGTPIQTWTLVDVSGVADDDKEEWWDYSWATRICQLELNEDAIDYVSNRWDGAVIEFIACPNGWDESFRPVNLYDYGFFGTVSTCFPNSDIESENAMITAPLTEYFWQALGGPYAYYSTNVILPTEGNDTALIKVGFEKPTIMPPWDMDGKPPGMGPGIEIENAPGINAPGYWNADSDAAANSMKIRITGQGKVPRSAEYPSAASTGREWDITVKGGDTTIATLHWEDDDSPWNQEPPRSVYYSNYLDHGDLIHYFTQLEWNDLSRSDQENLTVSIEISGYDEGRGYPDEHFALSHVAIQVGQTAWMGLYMAKGSNTGTWPDPYSGLPGWTGYSSPDTGLALYFNPEGINRLCLVEYIKSTI